MSLCSILALASCALFVLTRVVVIALVLARRNQIESIETGRCRFVVKFGKGGKSRLIK